MESQDQNDVYEYLNDMIDIKVELNDDFDTEERNLISVGFRNYIGHLETAIRVMKAINKTEKYKKYGGLIPNYIRKLSLQVKDQCLEIIEVLRQKCYKVCSDNEAMCYFQKLIGDYYRYAHDATLLERYHEVEEVKVKEDEKSNFMKLIAKGDSKPTENSSDLDSDEEDENENPKEEEQKPKKSVTFED